MKSQLPIYIVQILRIVPQNLITNFVHIVSFRHEAFIVGLNFVHEPLRRNLALPAFPVDILGVHNARLLVHVVYNRRKLNYVSLRF